MNQSIRPHLLRILRNFAIMQTILLVAIALIGYQQHWFEGAIQTEALGTGLFFAGIGTILLAGFSIGGVRQMPMGSGAFIAMQAIGTESDGNPDAKARLFGFVGFLKSYSAPLGIGLAGLLTLLVGILLQGR